MRSDSLAMKIFRNLVIILIIASVVISNRVWNKGRGIQEFSPCYYQKIGTTESLLSITNQDSDYVTGTLVIHNFDKDSSFGTFSGQKSEMNLHINFKFWSEGVLSNRKIIYKIKKNLLIGDGFEYRGQTNCENILYSQGLSSIPYKVKLSLELFPNLKIFSPDKSELIKLLGQSYLPVEALKIVYLPKNEIQTTIANIFYWESKVWDEVSSQEGAPDWGKKITEGNGKVLSVNTVQDCVYKSEIDCKNVSKLYKLLNNPELYSSI